MINTYGNEKRLQRLAAMLSTSENGLSVSKTLKPAGFFHKKEDTAAFRRMKQIKAGQDNFTENKHKIKINILKL